MRSSTVAMVAALLLATLAPTAAAAPSSLAFDAPASTPANSTVPVTVTLSLSGFLCHEPHAVTVQLATTSTEGVKGTFQRTTLTFDIPAESFFGTGYSRSQVVNLTVRAIASGSIDMTATLAADVGPCFVPGGFDPATATATLAVEGPASLATPTNSTNGTATGNETNATNTSATPKPATPKATGNGKPSCGPDGGCGPIGEYDAPQESADNGVPGVTPLVAIGVLAASALVARRLRRS